MALWGAVVSQKSPASFEVSEGHLDLIHITLLSPSSSSVALSVSVPGKGTFVLGRLNNTVTSIKSQIVFTEDVTFQVQGGGEEAEVQLLGNLRSPDINEDHYDSGSECSDDDLMDVNGLDFNGALGGFMNSRDIDSESEVEGVGSETDDGNNYSSYSSSDEEEEGSGVEIDYFKSGKLEEISDEVAEEIINQRNMKRKLANEKKENINKKNNSEAKDEDKSKVVSLGGRELFVVPKSIESKKSFGAQVSSGDLGVDLNNKKRKVSEVSTLTSEGSPTKVSNKKKPKIATSPTSTTSNPSVTASSVPTSSATGLKAKQATKPSSSSSDKPNSVDEEVKSNARNAAQILGCLSDHQSVPKAQKKVGSNDKLNKIKEASANQKASSNPTINNATKSQTSDSTKVQSKKADTKKGPSTTVNPDVKRELQGGVKIEVKSVGSGKVAAVGRRVKVRYEGRLAQTGKKFDGGVLDFTVGGGDMIKGFDAGVRGMLTRENRRVFIPSKMGYGNKRVGGIPSNSDLIFDISLLSVN